MVAPSGEWLIGPRFRVGQNLVFSHILGVMASYIGARILVTVDDGVYEGTLTAIDTCNGRLTLGRGRVYPTNSRFSAHLRHLNFGPLAWAWPYPSGLKLDIGPTCPKPRPGSAPNIQQ